MGNRFLAFFTRRSRNHPVRQSLISLGIVALIVVLLALIAIPSYQDYSGRARFYGPVYNAQLTPQLSRRNDKLDQPVILAGQDVTLYFGIAKPWPTSDLALTEPNSRIVNANEDVPLTLALACSFCERHAPYLRDLVYRHSTQDSNVVSFVLKPRVSPHENDPYLGTLNITVTDDRSGEEYDRFELEVQIVNKPGPDQHVLETLPPVIRAGADIFNGGQIVPFTSVGQIDSQLTLHISEYGELGVAIKVVPHDDALIKYLGNHDASTLFRTGVRDRKALEALTGEGFLELSGISFQKALAKLLRQPEISEDARKSLQLNQKQAAHVVETIGRVGKNLYGNLFVEGEDGARLEEIIRRIEAFAAERIKMGEPPIRMKIATDGLSLPWQYLHPTGSIVNAERFWGFLFSLSVQRANNRFARFRPIEGQEKSKVVFARYAGQSDPTVKLADEQLVQIKRLLDNEPLVVTSSKGFLNQALTIERTKVSAIIAFLHAGSGTTLVPAARSVVLQQDLRGPLLFFSEVDWVSTPQLDGLIHNLQAQDRLASPLYLKRRPLVLLNACETGPSTFPIPHVTLEEQFFKLGAQGIVVTEVSVWVNLGHEVASQLFERLARGEPAGDALTAVRRDIYAKYQNPLGLLYAYYGDPAAVLRP